jgi:hypothetical protein
MMQEEKRKFERIVKPIAVRYAEDTSLDAEKWDMTCTRNISAGGMCIVTSRYYSPEKILHFLLKIPLRPFEWQQVKGRVIGCINLTTSMEELIPNSYITRLEFLDLKEEQKNLINEYVRWFLKKFGGEK